MGAAITCWIRPCPISASKPPWWTFTTWRRWRGHRADTRAIYIETLGNPNSDIPDLEALAQLAHRHGLPLVVDNTFGACYWLRPLTTGRDLVIHSATKFLGGHGTTLGASLWTGANLTGGLRQIWGHFRPPIRATTACPSPRPPPAPFVTYVRAILLRDLGASISPFAAFLLLQGLETLSLRLERQGENTRRVVEFLAQHPLVERVRHPLLPDHRTTPLPALLPRGGGSIFTFDIKGAPGRPSASSTT